MEKLRILCVDDQREVLAALSKDLEPLESHFEVLKCESAAEATELLEEINDAGGHTALIICDHIMPGETGVQFLKRLVEDETYRPTKRLLLTGLATHEDTIQAINLAKINCYIEKPWDEESLLKKVKKLLTEYVLESGLDYHEYLPNLDSDTLYRLLKSRV